MSIPHTGKLEAEIRGHHCSFNGDEWTTPDANLTALLNAASQRERMTHMSIYALAVATLESEGLTAESKILSWENDSWGDDEELPSEAVD